MALNFIENISGIITNIDNSMDNFGNTVQSTADNIYNSGKTIIINGITLVKSVGEDIYTNVFGGNSINFKDDILPSISKIYKDSVDYIENNESFNVVRQYGEALKQNITKKEEDGYLPSMDSEKKVPSDQQDDYNDILTQLIEKASSLNTYLTSSETSPSSSSVNSNFLQFSSLYKNVQASIQEADSAFDDLLNTKYEVERAIELGYISAIYSSKLNKLAEQLNASKNLIKYIESSSVVQFVDTINNLCGELTESELTENTKALILENISSNKTQLLNILLFSQSSLKNNTNQSSPVDDFSIYVLESSPLHFLYLMSKIYSYSYNTDNNSEYTEFIESLSKFKTFYDKFVENLDILLSYAIVNINNCASSLSYIIGNYTNQDSAVFEYLQTIYSDVSTIQAYAELISSATIDSIFSEDSSNNITEVLTSIRNLKGDVRLFVSEAFSQLQRLIICQKSVNGIFNGTVDTYSKISDFSQELFDLFYSNIYSYEQATALDSSQTIENSIFTGDEFIYPFDVKIEFDYDDWKNVCYESNIRTGTDVDFLLFISYFLNQFIIDDTLTSVNDSIRKYSVQSIINDNLYMSSDIETISKSKRFYSLISLKQQYLNSYNMEITGDINKEKIDSYLLYLIPEFSIFNKINFEDEIIYNDYHGDFNERLKFITTSILASYYSRIRDLYTLFVDFFDNNSFISMKTLYLKPIILEIAYKMSHSAQVIYESEIEGFYSLTESILPNYIEIYKLLNNIDSISEIVNLDSIENYYRKLYQAALIKGIYKDLLKAYPGTEIDYEKIINALIDALDKCGELIRDKAQLLNKIVSEIKSKISDGINTVKKIKDSVSEDLNKLKDSLITNLEDIKEKVNEFIENADLEDEVGESLDGQGRSVLTGLSSKTYLEFIGLIPIIKISYELSFTLPNPEDPTQLAQVSTDDEDSFKKFNCTYGDGSTDNPLSSLAYAKHSAIESITRSHSSGKTTFSIKFLNNSNEIIKIIIPDSPSNYDEKEYEDYDGITSIEKIYDSDSKKYTYSVSTLKGTKKVFKFKDRLKIYGLRKIDETYNATDEGMSEAVSQYKVSMTFGKSFRIDIMHDEDALMGNIKNDLASVINEANSINL